MEIGPGPPFFAFPCSSTVYGAGEKNPRFFEFFSYFCGHFENRSSRAPVGKTKFQQPFFWKPLHITLISVKGAALLAVRRPTEAAGHPEDHLHFNRRTTSLYALSHTSHFYNIQPNTFVNIIPIPESESESHESACGVDPVHPETGYWTAVRFHDRRR